MVSLPIVFLIFITSNYPGDNVTERTFQDAWTNTNSDPNLRAPVPVQQDPLTSPRVNDLTLSDFKFPTGDDVGPKPSEPMTETKPAVQESGVREVIPTKNKAPVPLYSLVKNACEKGYVMDENGVCQKAIVLRTGKEFDSERRRRRRRRRQVTTMTADGEGDSSDSDGDEVVRAFQKFMSAFRRSGPIVRSP